MTRKSWVFINGEMIPKEEFYASQPQTPTGVTFLPDLPDFVSPIDGKHYSGRTGMRNHNARHSVVPVSDLQGLPTLTTNSDMRTDKQKRQLAESRREILTAKVDQYYK